MLIPELESYEFKPLDSDKMDDDESEPTVPNIPEWFGASPNPIRAKLPRPPSLVLNGKEITPLTVFGAEDRRIYNDTRYPWGTICKVVTSAGTGSGVIVGPRHVLTASHVVDWSRNGAGTVEVHRSGGSVRASTAIRRVWYYTRITGRNIPSNQLDEDYAVLVTSDRIGDLFGWMGTKTYSSSWDNKPFWYNIGYPSSIGSAMRPTFQRDQKLDEPWYDLGPARSMSTQADLTPGNSGGPMFAFWSDGPYVVAVVSAESSRQNWCSGGQWLTKLVHKARQEDA
jgi:V8-like Glu-specific endopeptidase